MSEYRRKQLREVMALAFALMMSPLAMFAQDGIVARQQSPDASQPAKPAGSGAAAQQNPPNSITQPLTLSPDIGPQRVGVDTSQVQTLAMQEAIAFALQNNLDIEQFRQGVQISQQSLYALRGVYDILSSSDVNYRSQSFPVASIFQGGGQASAITQKTLTYNFTTDQAVERTGGFWQVDFNNNRLTTSSTASTLPLQYNATLNFTFTQPLMRNFSIDQNRRLIQIAKKTVDLSDSQFRQRVIEIINQVQRAYWDLVFAIRNEKIAREAVELAKTQLQNNQKMVEAGTLAPIELRSSEAALESRKGNVILALQSITTAENALKNLLLKDSNDKMWSAAISPTDQPEFGTTKFNLEESIRLAMKNRPELDQLRLQTEQKNIDLKYFQNQTKPQIDFVGIYGDTGLAGAPSTLVQGGGFSDVTSGIIHNLNSALNALSLPTYNPIPPSPTTVGSGVPDRFNGGYGQALKNLFGQDFRTWQVGVRLSFPWRNRAAEGNLGRALAESRQLDAKQRQLVEIIQVDVRNGLQSVEAARQRFEAARAGRLAADAQLKGEVEKFRAGLSTNFFVLQRQNDLTVAQGTELQALTDYNKALADLQRVTGMTLVSNNVQVNATDGSTKK